MDTFKQEDVFNESLKYFKGDELAARVWVNKYCLKDKIGNLKEKSPRDMHVRLASEFARIEKRYDKSISYEEIFNLFDNFKYIIPQGRPMAGIGNPYQIQSSSNCYLVPSPLDNYASIMKTDATMAQIFKMGGGNGVNISKLRPSGMRTSNSPNGIAGATTYMDRYSYTTGEVCQNNRRK